MQVGSICYTTCQGIAHLARDFYLQGVVNRLMTYQHPHYQSYPERYQGKEHIYSSNKGVEEKNHFLDGLDILFLFETGLNWEVVQEASRRGIKIVVMPMYEYTPNPFPVKVDLYLCPSLLDLDYYQADNLPSVFLPVPVNKPWRQREVAKEFIHNAGHGQYQFAKGTPELIEAMRYVQSPITLLIRGQPGERKIERLFSQYRRHPKIRFDLRELPEEELYSQGDVFIYPEKYNGLSLPLQEAYASGMLVMTTNRYPANTWLPGEPLIPVRSFENCSIARTFKRAILDPKDIARVIDTWYEQDIRDLSQRGRDWAIEHSWSKLKPFYLETLESVL